jgi:hypothetical protein
MSKTRLMTMPLRPGSPDSEVGAPEVSALENLDV